MKIFQLVLILTFVICVCGQDEPQIRGRSPEKDFLDRGSYILADTRRMLWKTMGSKRKLEQENRADHKTQDILFKIRPEFKDGLVCGNLSQPENRRSLVPPENVREVRVADIDIVSAMGDSLSSGNGALSNQILHVPNEFRSISWSGGGKADYRKYITFPNILKVFNPNLYGYAVSDGLTIDKGSKFNVAEPMTMSPDMVFQARNLINRMRQDPKVDMKKHWKMLTIFVGSNDFCSDSCHYKSYDEWVELHAKELVKVLRVLRDNVPRLIVNIIGLPDYTIMYRTKNSPIFCYGVYRVGCHCLFKPDMNDKKLKLVKQGIDLWNRRDESICNMPEFHTKDFAALYQPFMTNVSFFTDEKNGIADFSFMANDCFHFSQLGHAMMSLGLWQNLFEPPEKKTITWNPPMTKYLQINCPTKEYPYIRIPKIN